MNILKADLHLHTAEDPYDAIEWNARQVIDEASRQGFDVLAITNHLSVCHSDGLAEYAAERDVLLIRGCESQIAGRHVLLLNPTKKAARARTFDELREAKSESRHMVVSAPHPFFPTRAALGELLYRNADLFDAVEWCSYYFRWLNFNIFARRAARVLGLPMIGGSDSHFPVQFGRTYSLIDAEPTVESVIDAIIKGNLRVVTKPLKVDSFAIHLGMRGMGFPDRWLWPYDGCPGNRSGPRQDGKSE